MSAPARLKWTAVAILVGTFAVVLFHRTLRSEPNAIDLSNYHITFNEDFSSFSISPWGPNTRWIAHTPWNGDFGDAQFADPVAGFPSRTEFFASRRAAAPTADGDRG
jgi:hypothetical protein